MSLSLFLDEALGAGRASDDTVSALSALAVAAIEIAGLVQRNGISADLGEEIGGTNSDGDSQKALDVRAEELITHHLSTSGAAFLLSEEQDDPVPLAGDGSVIVAVDPLDGSSNISVNVTIGTIFSILPAGPMLQPGRNQLAAGFFTYGPQTTLILAFAEGGCQCFVLDPDQGEFLTMGGPVSIPEQTSEFAINAAYSNHWFPPVRAWMDGVLEGKSGPYKQSYRMRWVGSLVADAWRIFQRGGVFLYPGDDRLGNRQGRLRLVYEASPMAFLAERAGAIATDGSGSILEIEPDSLHQRVPLIFGSAIELRRLMELHRH